MRYQGGKGRLSALLAVEIERFANAHGTREIEDRFCGGLAVSLACWRRGLRVARIEDGNPALIACYRALVEGWDPPAVLSAEDYRAIRLRADPADPVTAFALAFCSYGGKWAAGRIPDDLRWPGSTARYAAAAARRDLLEVRPLLLGAEIVCGDCLGPVASRRVAYADPPYRGTCGYPGAPPADLEVVWAALRGAGPVVGSEADPWPEGWREVWRWTNPRRGLRAQGGLEVLLTNTIVT